MNCKGEVDEGILFFAGVVLGIGFLILSFPIIPKLWGILPFEKEIDPASRGSFDDILRNNIQQLDPGDKQKIPFTLGEGMYLVSGTAKCQKTELCLCHDAFCEKPAKEVTPITFNSREFRKTQFSSEQIEGFLILKRTKNVIMIDYK